MNAARAPRVIPARHSWVKCVHEKEPGMHAHTDTQISSLYITQGEAVAAGFHVFGEIFIEAMAFLSAA
jgi:hypothetical protein